MELDDLKQQWRQTELGRSPDEIRAAMASRISGMKKSGKGIRYFFIFETVFVLLMYFVIAGLMWLMGDKLTGYMYKIIVVVFVTILPVLWRLYKVQRWVNSIDYAQDIRSNIEQFVRYSRSTLRLYSWSTYLVVVILLVIFFTDPEFMGLSFNTKAFIIGYLVVVALSVSTYVRFAYGRRLDVFEAFLKDS